MGEHGAVQRGKKKNLRCGRGGGCAGAEAARPRGGIGASDEFPPTMETRPFNGVWSTAALQAEPAGLLAAEAQLS